MLSSRGVQPNRCLPNLQKIVRNSWQQQSPWKTSLNELSINKNAVLHHATLLSQEKMKLIKLLHKYLSSFSWNFFDNSIKVDICIYCCSKMFQRCSFKIAIQLKMVVLTISWRRSLSYRNQSIGLLWKSMDWFLYDGDLHHERVKEFLSLKLKILLSFLTKSIFVLCVLGFYYWF